MILFLCAQDLSCLWVGLLAGTTVRTIEQKMVFPEQYLQEIDAFLMREQISLEELSGVSVVTGPGSFTASRLTLTIANTIHFTHQLPLFALQNEENLTPIALIEKCGIGEMIQPEQFAHAFYNRPPHITTPSSTHA